MSKVERGRLAKRLEKQLEAWMRIRTEHSLAEQEIGYISSLIACLELGEVGRTRYAEKSIEHSKGLLDLEKEHRQERRERKEQIESWHTRESTERSTIVEGYRYALDLFELLEVMQEKTPTEEQLDAGEIHQVAVELIDSRKAYDKASRKLRIATENAGKMRKKLLALTPAA